MAARNLLLEFIFIIIAVATVLMLTEMWFQIIEAAVYTLSL